MRPAGGLRLLVAGQFLGALADSALLVVALQALTEERAPDWQAPMLRILFYGAYVLLAVISGAVADAFAKRDVLVVTGLMKLAGCAMLAAGASPLAAYAFVGFGAVSHMPARYGILGEIVAPEGLLRANAWLEGATLSAMLAGVVIGGAILSGASLPLASASSAHTAASWLLAPYLAAVVCCMFLRRTPAAVAGLRTAAGLPRQFAGVARALLAEPSARKALSFTTIFWAMAAVLQFEVLRWAGDRFGLPLAQAVLLQLAVALGMIVGAAAAGRWATAARLQYVPWAGMGAGVAMVALALVQDLRWAVALLAALGGLAGLVLVPMNAVVQERGAKARRPGEWLAAQHFVENAGSLVLLALYGAAIFGGMSTTGVIVLLGVMVAVPAIAAAWAERSGSSSVAVQSRR